MRLQEKINKYGGSKKFGIELQPLVGKDFFSELQKQNMIDQRISKDMDLSLTRDQVLSIQNLKYLQGLKRRD